MLSPPSLPVHQGITDRIMVKKKEAPLHAVKRPESVGFAFYLAMSPESLLLAFMGFLASFLSEDFTLNL